MTINWLGQNCFKIEGKTGTVLIDPVDPSVGKMSKVGADLLVLPRAYPEKNRTFLKDEAFVVETPGEFEVKNVFARTMAAGPAGELVTRLELDGIRLGHVGSLAATSDDVGAFLENVDVLFVPTGGGSVLSPAAAAELVSAIEPRIVIPMHFKSDGQSGLQPVEKFCQAMGMKTPEAQPKLSLTAKDLPNDETKLFILDQ